MKTIQIPNQRVQRRIRKVMVLLCVTGGALLAAAQVRGQTAPSFITIDDTGEGNPVVTVSTDISGAPGYTLTLGTEQATVTFQNPALPSGGPTFPTFSGAMILTESSSDNTPSDYVTLDVSQFTVTLLFRSDGAADFRPPPAGTPTTPETGKPQSMFPNYSGIQVNVTSDVDPTPTSDSASTMVCFGIALVGLAGFGRKLGGYRSGE